MRVWVLLIAACSTPAPKQEPVKPPADDEAASVAWQAKHPKVDAQVHQTGSAEPAWTFDWDGIRKTYDALMATPPGSKPCDWRVQKTRAQGEPECLPPGRPLWHAAKVKHFVGRSEELTELELDIGERDKLTVDWWGTLLGDDGMPMADWAHPFNIGGYDSFLLIKLPYWKVGRKNRVALVKERPTP